MLLDIHTHQPPLRGNWAIQSLHGNFEQVSLPGRFSIGLHPWYIEKDNLHQSLQVLTQYCNHPHVLAIGECGLDKLSATAFDLQTEAFAAQVQLANAINKPLIVHCVRAYNEVLQILKQQQNNVPVVFHGFNKNEAIAKRLVEEGHYLSFGKALQQQRLQQVLNTVPLSSVLLETDDAAVDIKDIYHLAATALHIGADKLDLQLQKNAVAIFGADSIEL